MIYGYARVSTRGQVDGTSLDSQEKALAGEGCGKIYKEAYTGTTKERPELQKLLAEISEGDTLVVVKLDRIARNTIDGVEIIQDIINKGAKLHILNIGWFEDNPTGRMMITIMLAFAQLERDTIYERTQGGRQWKRENDPLYKEGRKALQVDLSELKEQVIDGELTVAEACKVAGISRSYWYKHT